MRRAALALVLAISCTQPPSPSSSPASPSPGAVATRSPVVVTAPPTQSTANPLGIVQAMPLGPLSGSWVIALRETQQVDGYVRVEVIATPFGISSPRVAVSFVQPSGGVNLPAPNGIGGQLSPDGRSIVLGVEGRTRGGELFVVDLEMGRARSLGEGVMPVWGGAGIAFQRRHPTDVYGAGTSWIIDPAGGSPTHIPDDAVPLLWHRDSLVVATVTGLEIRVPADARIGFPIPAKLDNGPVGERPVSDRAASGVTVLAVPTFTGTDIAATHRIEVVSTPGAGTARQSRPRRARSWRHGSRSRAGTRIPRSARSSTAAREAADARYASSTSVAAVISSPRRAASLDARRGRRTASRSCTRPIHSRPTVPRRRCARSGP